MTEKALKRLEDLLKCPICRDTYTDPKMLQCYHEFCRNCLTKPIIEDQQGQLVLPCPVCRQVTPVPDKGVAGLQAAFHANQLLDIANELKNDSSPSTDRTEGESAIFASQLSMSENCCPEHGKAVEYYCESCAEEVCWSCTAKDGKHHDHDCKELDKSYETQQREITASLKPIKQQLTSIRKALKQLDSHLEEIRHQETDIKTEIHRIFKNVQECLDARKADLISQLQQMAEMKLMRLKVQKDQIKTGEDRLSSYLGIIKESLRTSSMEEVVLMKKSIVKQVNELMSTFPKDILKPTTEADMAFSTPTDIIDACQNYGHISSQDLPDPSRCYVTGEGIEAAQVGKIATAILHATNFRGDTCEEPIKSSEIELVSEINGTRIRGTVDSSGSNQYEISYRPTMKGQNQLHVKVEGQHIRESPFRISVTSPVEELGTPIIKLSGLNQPRGVTINQKGEVVVTEMGAYRVSIFDVSGKKLRSFGTYGSGEGQFMNPRGVAIDNEGNILVADWMNYRIQKFTAEGQFLATVGSEGIGRLQFGGPDSIAFNTTNNKVYVTDNNHDVQVLNSDFSFYKYFGGKGSSDGKFNLPGGIACDSKGNVYVADCDNQRIQVFTAEGEFLRKFGTLDKKSHPIGIAIDSKNLVYVSEYLKHRISVFTSAGKFVTSFGGPGEKPGQLKCPCGIAVDSGVVYVCDYDNSRVQFY